MGSGGGQAGVAGSYGGGDYGSGGGGAGAGGGGGMGGMGMGQYDFTLGRGKTEAQTHSNEMDLLKELLSRQLPGMQVTGGQTPGAAPVMRWTPAMVQTLLHSFNGG